MNALQFYANTLFVYVTEHPQLPNEVQYAARKLFTTVHQEFENQVPNLQQDQALFREVGGAPADLELCKKLIHEEINTELFDHLDQLIANNTLELRAKVLDDIVDSVYVLLNLCNALDLPFYEGWREVQKANMNKFPGGKVIRREDGKILKPANWQAPNMWRVVYDWETKREYADKVKYNWDIKV